MPVVAAAVHPAPELRRMRKIVFFVHGQRIHVRAQADCSATFVALARDHGDDAGTADARVVLDAEPVELAGDDLGRSMLLESELGVCVQIASQLGELRVLAAKVIDRAHGDSLVRFDQCAGTSRSMRKRGSTA